MQGATEPFPYISHSSPELFVPRSTKSAMLPVSHCKLSANAVQNELDFTSISPYQHQREQARKHGGTWKWVLFACARWALERAINRVP